MKLFGMILFVGSLATGLAPASAADDPTANEESERPATDVAEDTATHREIGPLSIEFKRLTALRIDLDGNLLASDGDTKQIKVIGSDGKQSRTIELPFAPEAIDVAPDGVIYCGGEGRIAQLDADGKILKTIDVPSTADTAVSETSVRRAEICKVTLALRVSGIAVSKRYVFATFGTGWSTVAKAKLFRFDRNLENPKMLAENLRGCCMRCDLVTDGRIVYLAENSAHRVVGYNRNGKQLSAWGSRSREGLEGFGACCNPMNVCFDGDGVLYTAESGLGRIKRYSKQGEMLSLVGYVDTDRFTSGGAHAASCSNMAVAVTPDGSRIYVMDYNHNKIRVLQKKD
ncbi:MAG TPA: hypothetical protein VE890_00915 [Thermoguttaceae bacterium]|nr:hypothetical protein [Thermoguttaceae bacterium]